MYITLLYNDVSPTSNIKMCGAADLNVTHALLVAPQAHLTQNCRLASPCISFTLYSRPHTSTANALPSRAQDTNDKDCAMVQPVHVVNAWPWTFAASATIQRRSDACPSCMSRHCSMHTMCSCDHIVEL